MPRSFSTRNTMLLSQPNSAVQKQKNLEELEKTKNINEGNFQVTKFISSYLDKLDLDQKSQFQFPPPSNNSTNPFFNLGKQLSTKEQFDCGGLINKFFSTKKKSTVDNNIELFKTKSKCKNISNSNSNNNSNNTFVSSFFKNKQHSKLQHNPSLKEDNMVSICNKEEGSENDVKNFILTKHFSSVVGEKKKKQPAVSFGTCFGTGLGSLVNNNINYQDSSDALLGGLESTLIQTNNNNNSNSNNTKVPFNPSDFLLTKRFSTKKRGNDMFILNKRAKGSGTGGFILNHISQKTNTNDSFILSHKGNSNNKSASLFGGNNSNSNKSNSGFVLNYKPNTNNKNAESSNNNTENTGDFILNHRTLSNVKKTSPGSSFLNGNGFILNHNASSKQNTNKFHSFINNNTSEKTFTLKYNHIQLNNKKTLPKDNDNNNDNAKCSDKNSFILSNISSHSKVASGFTLNFRNKCSLNLFNQPHQQVLSGLELLQRVSTQKSKISSTQLDSILKLDKVDNNNNNDDDGDDDSMYAENTVNKSSKMLFDFSKKSKNRSNKELYKDLSFFGRNIKSLQNVKSNKTLESKNTKYNNELFNRFKSSHSRQTHLNLFRNDSLDTKNQYNSSIESKSARNKERTNLSIILVDKKDENDIRNILDLNKNEYHEFNKLCTQLHQNISLRPQEDDVQMFDALTNEDKNKEKDSNLISKRTMPLQPQKTIETANNKKSFTNTNTINHNETLTNHNNINNSNTLLKAAAEEEEEDNKVLNEIKYRYLPSNLAHVYDSLDDEENHDEVKETYYLEPFTMPRFIYDMLLFLLEIYSLVFIPYDLAFTLHSSYTLGWKFLLNLLIDCMFIIDIILGFFTAYYNNEETLIVDIPLISVNYIKTWFPIDLISGLPLNTLIDVFRYIYPHSYFATVSSTSFHSNYIILINVLKCLRLVKGMKVFFYNSFSVKVSECVLNRFPSGKGFRLLITLLIFTICIHTFASFLVFFGNAFYPNWIVNYGLDPEDDTEVYVAGIYFVCVSIIGVGYGDILCSNLAEKTLALILLTFGLGIYSWAISALSAFFTVDDLKTFEYKIKMDILDDINSSYKNVTIELIEKIQRHLLYRLNSDKIDCNSIIQDLPYSLRNAMLFEMYKPIINHFVFFKNFNSLDFIFKVIICLKPVYAVRNEKLINDGELVEETVFVKNGKLSLEFPLPLVFNNETLSSLTRQISFSLSSDMVTYEQTSFIENLLRSGLAERNVIAPSNTNLHTSKSFKCKLTDSQNANANYISCKKNNLNLKEYTHNQQYVKLIEIRRNEHFGDVLMFLDKKSPLLAKVKTKKADLFLLKKTDAVDIAGQFPDIWKQIVRKSLFNMKQINRLINRSLKFFFIHYEGHTAHDKSNMKNNYSNITNTIITNTDANGLNTVSTMKGVGNSRNTYVHQTNIDTCIGLLGEDEGDFELESVPDSDDMREEVEMEKMLEQGNNIGDIGEDVIGSVDETTKVGSEKKDLLSARNLVSLSRGNESNNGEAINEGGSDYDNQIGEDHQQKISFLLRRDNNNNNINNNIEPVISHKDPSDKSKESDSDSSSDESKSNSNRSNDTIKRIHTKDNNNVSIANINSITINNKQSLRLQTQAVLSTKSSIKEIPKLQCENNAVDDKEQISLSHIDSTFRHKSTVKVSSHDDSYNDDINKYDLIDNESINSEYHSDEHELKKNILFSRTKRSNQPLLPPKDNKQLLKSTNPPKPEQDALNDSFFVKSRNSHNDKFNMKFSKDKSPSVLRKLSRTPTEKSNKSGSVQSKDLMNGSIGFHSIHSSKSNLELLKEGGSMNFNAPETENNVSFLGSSIKLHATNKINSSIVHSQIVNNSMSKMHKRHSVCPVNNSLFCDMIGKSLK